MFEVQITLIIFHKSKKFCLWEPVIDQEESKERPLRVDDPSEVALQEQLKSVAACSELRNAVKNEDLQRRIRKIDSSEDAETELDKAMEGDVFRTLMDKALPPIGTKCVLRIGASCKHVEVLGDFLKPKENRIVPVLVRNDSNSVLKHCA
ncbi:uncharacterized protein LOC116186956 isoform X2 [Punica granatum]|uniref:Uncharacterized protein LOC116186956 isoform X2 n=1 Tax=Punica granatum TaxID=22663 RepID=A0A6P8BNK7_PUNGR|nr:uncharacterized protein LOC116186956 isoform X2 [Punica granatum]XP_031371377.1 uncharacterized protein LOC116186956 isoform X2 [Punica granatum]